MGYALIVAIILLFVALWRMVDLEGIRDHQRAQIDELTIQRDNLKRIADAERGYAAAEHERAEYFHGELLKLAEKIKAKAAQAKKKAVKK